MEQNNRIILFQEKQIRRVWKDDEWWFVIEDIVLTLTDSANPKNYIRDIRRRDAELSKGWGQIAHTLTVETQGGKQRMNCANTKGILRLIMSIPSPKAEPFKLWLSEVGYERIQEIENPEHKQLKGLERQNLRDHMTNLELIFTMLGEESTRQIAVEDDAQGFNENKDTALKGGHAAGTARKSYEKTRNVKVVSSDNFLNLLGSNTIDVPLLETDDVD